MNNKSEMQHICTCLITLMLLSKSFNSFIQFIPIGVAESNQWDCAAIQTRLAFRFHSIAIANVISALKNLHIMMKTASVHIQLHMYVCCMNIMARIMFQGKEKTRCKCHYVYLTEFQILYMHWMKWATCNCSE